MRDGEIIVGRNSERFFLIVTRFAARDAGMPDLKLIKRTELAEKLSMPPALVKEFTRQRKIPCVRLGHRTVRYDIEAVREALKRFEVKAVS